MTNDRLSNSIRHAFDLLRTHTRRGPVSLRAAVASHEDPDPDWQPL
ncbi:MAG: hypothetical protein WBV39_11730 [Rudaea sp.]